jgi:hypothetical protein
MIIIAGAHLKNTKTSYTVNITNWVVNYLLEEFFRYGLYCTKVKPLCCGRNFTDAAFRTSWPTMPQRLHAAIDDHD